MSEAVAPPKAVMGPGHDREPQPWGLPYLGIILRFYVDVRAKNRKDKEINKIDGIDGIDGHPLHIGIK